MPSGMVWRRSRKVEESVYRPLGKAASSVFELPTMASECEANPSARTESGCETSGNVYKPFMAMRLEWTSIPAPPKAPASACCCLRTRRDEMPVHTLIVDDESSARSRLRKLLAGFPEISVVGEAHDGIQAVSLIGEMRPDLVLLDVQMPGLDGFEVLRSLPPRTPWPLVIFATAFNQYALEAFEANAVG